MGPVREWSDIRRFAAGKPGRLLFLAALAVAVALLAVVGHCVPLRSASQPLHVATPLLSPVSGQIAGASHQPLLLDGKPMCKASKLLATAALPRSPIPALMLLGALWAGVVGKDWLTKPVVPAERGPPGALMAVLSGQDLLTRFCLARR